MLKSSFESFSGDSAIVAGKMNLELKLEIFDCKNGFSMFENIW